MIAHISTKVGHCDRTLDLSSAWEPLCLGNCIVQSSQDIAQRLISLAEIFSASSLNLSRMVGDVKREHAQLVSAIKELGAMAGTASPDKEGLKELIRKLDAANSRLSEKLSKFRLR